MTDPRELERIRQEEFNITSRRIKLMIDAGANVILCTKGIDDMALKYFVSAGAIACRRVPKVCTSAPGIWNLESRTPEPRA